MLHKNYRQLLGYSCKRNYTVDIYENKYKFCNFCVTDNVYKKPLSGVPVGELKGKKEKKPPHHSCTTIVGGKLEWRDTEENL